MKGEIQMSCPYLEKGKTAYCHAFGGERLAVESPEIEDFCFSGEFSECSFLFLPLSVQYGTSRGRRNSLPGPFKTSWQGYKNSINGTPIG
jgi:hypothetical protein